MTHSDEPSELQPEQPSEHAGSSEAGSNEPGSNEPGSNEPGSSEDLKKKFREALERKNSRHHATVEANSGSKISHAHGSASQKREFRRKSG